jgi:hypothetical protein
MSAQSLDLEKNFDEGNAVWRRADGDERAVDAGNGDVRLTAVASVAFRSGCWGGAECHKRRASSADYEVGWTRC